MPGDFYEAKKLIKKALIGIFFINNIIYGVSAEPYVELFITPASQESYTTGISYVSIIAG